MSKDGERSDGRLGILVSDVGPDRGFLDIHGGETTKEENAVVQTGFAESSQSTVKARIKHSGDSNSYKARSIRLWSWGYAPGKVMLLYGQRAIRSTN